MPYRRRSFKVKRRTKTTRRRSTRVRRSFLRGYVGSNKLTHKFKRVVSLTNDTTAVTGTTDIQVSAPATVNYTAGFDGWDLATGTGGTGFSYISLAFRFKVSALPGFGDFNNLYDMYHIRAIKIKITPYSTGSQLQQGTTLANNQSLSCVIHHLVDPDDGVAFVASNVGIDAMRQYPTYKTRNLFNSSGKSITRTIKPRIAIAAFDSAPGSSATARLNYPSRMLDMATPNVDHFAWKMIMEIFQPDTTIACFIWWKMEATYYLSMRTPR